VRVLVAEDDAETAEFICQGLHRLGHVARSCADGIHAMQLAQDESWDVIVLDWMLPDLDGMTALRRLRGMGLPTPVLMLTAMGRIEDRVEGLETGADDYLVKPFAFNELAARLGALVRRRATSEAPTVLRHGALSLNLIKRDVHFGETPIALQPREFRLLEELMRHADRIMTRTMLLERVWEFHFDPQTNIVETHVSRLRAKLAEAGARDIIETVRGEGYRLRQP